MIYKNLLETNVTYAASDFARMIRERDYEGIKALAISKAPYLISALIIVVIGFIISNLIGKLLVKVLEKKKVDPSVHSFLRTIVTLTLKLIFILTALSTMKVNVNSFVAALAAGGVTAGIGLQQSISQIASGFQILINHPFKSGDFIDIGSVSGTVREIKIMYTVLITLDNKRVIVPNSTITTSNIINFTAERKRRIDLVYSISYDADIEKAKAALGEVAKECESVLDNPEPVFAVSEHSSSSINIACLVWCESRDYWKTFWYMQEHVKLKFDEEGIKIPYGQLDVHISGGEDKKD
ncbi:MAG: mechanosensitive ion channel [Clostridia bacterium]|nr:mechanosensitive ion channel [Clostridia bacterium]